MNTSTKAKGATFHQLHHLDQILILPNCWDALSAVVLKEAGAKAIATTSAGLAWAHGYADGEKLPVDALIRAIREITHVVDLPVTVDLESGFTDDLATFAMTIEAVIDAGAVGINLEYGSRAPELLGRKDSRSKRDRWPQRCAFFSQCPNRCCIAFVGNGSRGGERSDQAWHPLSRSGRRWFFRSQAWFNWIGFVALSNRWIFRSTFWLPVE